MISNIEKGHPWGDFLNARMIAMKWMLTEMKYSDADIAHALSMDARQVYLIRTNALNAQIFDCNLEVGNGGM
jgi:hypothetical protein